MTHHTRHDLARRHWPQRPIAARTERDMGRIVIRDNGATRELPTYRVIATWPDGHESIELTGVQPDTADWNARCLTGTALSR